MSGRFAYLEHDGVLAFAHRGGTSQWPENTMPAFQHSIDLGYRYLETDVHVSADGILFAFHDADLFRTTGHRGRIGDLEASEIDELVVDGRATIPRLDDILTTWPLARLNIDAKSDAAVLPLIRLVRVRRAVERVCIGSFVDRRVRLCRRELGPDLCTSMGQLEGLRLLMASQGFADPSVLRAGCAQLPPQRGSVRFTTTKLIELAHELDIDVHVWTINSADEMHALLDLGVDGIMSDEPALLRELLIVRGQWTTGRRPSDLSDTGRRASDQMQGETP